LLYADLVEAVQGRCPEFGYVVAPWSDYEPKSHQSARVCFARVISVVCKAEKPGTWKVKCAADPADGGLFFSNSCTVEARAYLGTRP
jgi:hypothetical protein